MPESEKLKQARARKEAQILSAAGRITQALGLFTTQEQEELKRSLQHLYVDWGNDFTHERATDLTEQLKTFGIEVRIAHFTGDSSFPTEYTINGDVHSVGPTFDMALIAFIQQLLKQHKEACNLLGDLRALLADESLGVEGMSADWHERYDTVFQRIYQDRRWWK